MSRRPWWITVSAPYGRDGKCFVDVRLKRWALPYVRLLALWSLLRSKCNPTKESS